MPVDTESRFGAFISCAFVSGAPLSVVVTIDNNGR